jgi:predicted DCC family thiol-disulfide oxidoreductase YuxK
MASLAAPGPTQRGSSWNPFRCADTALPAHVLLAAKLIAVFLIAHYIERYGISYSSGSRSLPLALAFALETVWYASQGLAVVFAVLLLCNRGVPWMGAALGLAVAVGFAIHSVNDGELFLGGFLLLAAFQIRRREPLLLRYWVVALQLVVGLSWVLGSGSAPLFDAWAGRELAANIPSSAGFAALESALPPGLLARVTDWAMALISFGLAVGFLIPRLFPLALWVAIALHCAWAVIAGPLDVLSYAVLACYLVFVAWPPEALVVIYDGECGFCNLTRQWVSRVDFDRVYDWRPFQSDVGETYGIPKEALAEKVHAVWDGRVYAGFRAFRAMLLYNPALYLAAALLLAAVGLATAAVRDGLFAALIVLLSPLFHPFGEAAYAWVARNRHRLPPRTCKVPD